MSDLVEYMKTMFLKAKNNDLEWKPIYPNNMPCNGKSGIYADMNIRYEELWTYIKVCIKYRYRTDESCISHPAEGIKYYVLFVLKIDKLEEQIIIPEPNDDLDPFKNDYSNLVNSEGTLRAIFDDEKTAKQAASMTLIHMIYPFMYVMNEEEMEEWNKFLDQIKD